ncbi:MAG: hypothetical protein IPK82_23130 [Polyangiaceae bacterium]|nr:hypothetical protein [Polyangiaceae bacterium]
MSAADKAEAQQVQQDPVAVPVATPQQATPQQQQATPQQQQAEATPKKRQRVMDLDTRLTLFDDKLCGDDEESDEGESDDDDVADADDNGDASHMQTDHNCSIDDDGNSENLAYEDEDPSSTSAERERIRQLDTEHLMTDAERVVWLRMFASRYRLAELAYRPEFTSLRVVAWPRTAETTQKKTNNKRQGKVRPLVVIFDRLSGVISALHRVNNGSSSSVAFFLRRGARGNNTSSTRRITVGFMEEVFDDGAPLPGDDSTRDNGVAATVAGRRRPEHFVHACASYVLADELRDKFVPQTDVRIARRLVPPECSSVSVSLRASRSRSRGIGNSGGRFSSSSSSSSSSGNAFSAPGFLGASYFLSARSSEPTQAQQKSAAAAQKRAAAAAAAALKKKKKADKQRERDEEGEKERKNRECAPPASPPTATTAPLPHDPRYGFDDEDDDDKNVADDGVLELVDPATAPLDTLSPDHDKRETLDGWRTTYPDWQPMTPLAFQRRQTKEQQQREQQQRGEGKQSQEYNGEQTRFTPPLVPSEAETAQPSFPRICAQSAFIVQALRDGGEIGPARALVRLFGDRVRVCNGGADANLGRKSSGGTRTAYLWAGHTFQRDVNEACIETLAHTTLVGMLQCIKARVLAVAVACAAEQRAAQRARRPPPPNDSRLVGIVDALGKQVGALARFSTVSKVVRFFKYMPGITVAPRAWNANNHLFGVLNGVLEFRITTVEAAATTTGAAAARVQQQQQQQRQQQQQQQQQRWGKRN